jgi:hypothetical protein
MKPIHFNSNHFHIISAVIRNRATSQFEGPPAFTKRKWNKMKRNVSMSFPCSSHRNPHSILIAFWHLRNVNETKRNKTKWNISVRFPQKSTIGTHPILKAGHHLRNVNATKWNEIKDSTTFFFFARDILLDWQCWSLIHGRIIDLRSRNNLSSGQSWNRL